MRKAVVTVLCVLLFGFLYPTTALEVSEPLTIPSVITKITALILVLTATIVTADILRRLYGGE